MRLEDSENGVAAVLPVRHLGTCRNVNQPPTARPRPKRWADAVDQLRVLQAEYEGLARPVCPSPSPTPGTAELLEGVCDVDLDILDVELPRGFGRD